MRLEAGLKTLGGNERNGDILHMYLNREMELGAQLLMWKTLD